MAEAFTAARRSVTVLRQIHRWTGIALFLFLAVIGITGTILQFLMSIYGDTGVAPASGEPLWVLHLRDLAVIIHTGAFSGVTGDYVGLICGLGLLYFSVSGIWMYLDLRRSRAVLGQRNWFWQTRVGADAAMRTLHRWFSPVLVLFAIPIAVTGVILDLVFAIVGKVPLPPPRSQLGGMSGAPPGFHDGGPGGPPGSGPGGPPGFGHGGPPGLGRAGLPGPELAGPPNAPWHAVSLSVHKLDFLGFAGHFIAVLGGLALTAMAISGIWMYVAIYARRSKAGLKGVFW